MSKNVRAVEVVGIRFEEPEFSPVLVLKELDGGRYVPIWIGAAEAAAISLHQQGVTPSRPLTHDLMADLLSTFSHSLKAVEIVGLSEGTYYAELVFDSGERISARPSDAVALALRTGTQVSVSEEVLGKAGISMADDGEEQVEAFREFLDNVSADDFLGDEGVGGSGSGN